MEIVQERLTPPCVCIVANNEDDFDSEMDHREKIEKEFGGLLDKAKRELVAELLAKHINPPRQIDQDTSGHFDDYYKNRPLVNPEGEIVCSMSLGDSFPKEAVDENGKLKPGWKWHIPLAE
jgi:hypothetical protein